MTFDLFVFQESLVEYVEFKFLSSDKVVGVAVYFPRVDRSCSVCVHTHMYNLLVYDTSTYMYIHNVHFTCIGTCLLQVHNMSMYMYMYICLTYNT